MRQVKIGETDAYKRTVSFQLVGTDGITPVTGKGGEQPEAYTNDQGSWEGAGSISTLSEVGNGFYTATVATALLATAGDVVWTRFKDGDTAECPGESLEIVSQTISDIDVSTIAETLAGSVVHVTSPTAPGGKTQLLTLATYSSGTGQRLSFPLPSTAPDAAGAATCVFKVLDATSGSYILELTGPITGTAGSQTGYITITTTNANLLTRGKDYRYRAFASYSGDLLPIAANTIRRDD